MTQYIKITLPEVGRHPYCDACIATDNKMASFIIMLKDTPDTRFVDYLYLCGDHFEELFHEMEKFMVLRRME